MCARESERGERRVDLAVHYNSIAHREQQCAGSVKE